MERRTNIKELKELTSLVEKLERALKNVSPAERPFVKAHLDYYREKIEELTGLKNPEIIFV